MARTRSRVAVARGRRRSSCSRAAARATGRPRPSARRRRRRPPTPAPRRRPRSSRPGSPSTCARCATRRGRRARAPPGRAATARRRRYIAGRLRAAGFRVTEPAFKVPLFLERSPRGCRGCGRSQFMTLTFSGSGRAAGHGAARRAGLRARRTTRALRRGDVALARRGVCTFSRRARLAQRAGAGALLVISDRGAPFGGSLGGPGARIPVLAVSTRRGPRARRPRARPGRRGLRAADHPQRRRRDRPRGRGAGA